MRDIFKKRGFQIFVSSLSAVLLFGTGFTVAASMRTATYRPNIISEFGARYNTSIGYVEEDGTILISTYDRFTKKYTMETVDLSTGEIVRSVSFNS